MARPHLPDGAKSIARSRVLRVPGDAYIRVRLPAVDRPMACSWLLAHPAR